MIVQPDDVPPMLPCEPIKECPLCGGTDFVQAVKLTGQWSIDITGAPYADSAEFGNFTADFDGEETTGVYCWGSDCDFSQRGSSVWPSPFQIKPHDSAAANHEGLRHVVLTESGKARADD